MAMWYLPPYKSRPQSDRTLLCQAQSHRACRALSLDRDALAVARPVRPALQPLNAAIFGIAVTQALNDHGNRSSRLGQRMEKHYPPEHLKRQFHCVHCGVFAAQQWEELFYQRGGRIATVDHWGYCVCAHCHQWSYWYSGKMVVPSASPSPPPHADMPTECLTDYNEAREIVRSVSKGSSRALTAGTPRVNPNVTIPRDPCADSTGHHRTERPENVDPPRHDP